MCENDCGYCGIRKHQRRARRYTMPADEVVEVADWAFKHRMGTLMLQVGAAAGWRVAGGRVVGGVGDACGAGAHTCR